MQPRDDFFTLIHKALRRGIFDVASSAGSTNWTDPSSVETFTPGWRSLVQLLEAHAHHEDEFFFALLEEKSPADAQVRAEDHTRLEAVLADLAARFESMVPAPSAESGLTWYRDLTRFVGEYLLHLLDEETRVMPLLWEHCSDDELAATRVAFMAAVDPVTMEASQRLMIPALNHAERVTLFARMQASAPRPVFDGTMALAREVLDAEAFVALTEELAPAPGAVGVA